MRGYSDISYAMCDGMVAQCKPKVATYGRATGHSFGGVTAMETAKLAEEWLSDNIRQTKWVWSGGG